MQVLRTFFYTGLVAALAIPMAAMSVINITIGSKWRVALRRAKLAGQLLARLLMQVRPLQQHAPAAPPAPLLPRCAP